MSDKYEATLNVNGDKRTIRVERRRSLAGAHGLLENPEIDACRCR
jgi:hypothetical protein